MFDHVFTPFVCLGTGQTIVSGAKVYTCFMPFKATVLSEGFLANATYEVGTHYFLIKILFIYNKL